MPLFLGAQLASGAYLSATPRIDTGSDSLADALMDAQVRLRLRDAALANLAARCDAAERTRDAIMPELGAQLSIKAAEIAILHSSTLWKVTAPLRRLSRFLGR